MGFRPNRYAKLWKKLESKGNYGVGTVSVSDKNRTTGEYETTFSSICRFVGKAYDAFQKMNPEDKFKILECDSTCKYDKEKKQSFYNFIIFDLEIDGQSKPAASPAKNPASAPSPADESEELPF